MDSSYVLKVESGELDGSLDVGSERKKSKGGCQKAAPEQLSG